MCLPLVRPEILKAVQKHEARNLCSESVSRKQSHTLLIVVVPNDLHSKEKHRNVFFLAKFVMILWFVFDCVFNLPSPSLWFFKLPCAVEAMIRAHVCRKYQGHSEYFLCTSLWHSRADSLQDFSSSMFPAAFAPRLFKELQFILHAVFFLMHLS